jgi:hypothetical protein
LDNDTIAEIMASAPNVVVVRNCIDNLEVIILDGNVYHRVILKEKYNENKS